MYNNKSTALKFSLLFLLIHLCIRVAAPVHSSEPAATRVPPFFWYESDPDTHRKFLMALLLYWSGKDTSGEFNLIAPFYYDSRTEEEKVRIFLPFHFQYHTDELQLKLWGPYFSKKSLLAETRFLLPFYFHAHTPESRSTLFTLYFRQQSSRYDSRVIFPLFWAMQYSDKSRKSYQTFIPFYFRTRGEFSETVISPFFWKYRDPILSQGIVPPYFWRYTDSRKTEVGFPLYWRFYWMGDEKVRDIRVAVPWFQVLTGQNSFRGFFPIYWGSTKVVTDEDNPSVLKRNEWNLLLPLMMSSKKPDGSKKIVTPLFSRFHDSDGKEYGHSGLNFFSYDNWGGKTEGLFPFFYHRQEPDFYKFRFLAFYMQKDLQEEHVQVSIFPLFRYRRDSDRKQLLTPAFYRDRDPDNSRGFFLNYYWSREPAYDKTVDDEHEKGDPAQNMVLRKRFFVPLIWHFQSENERTTLFLPLLASHQHPDYKLSIFLPLFFERVKGNDTLTIVPPLISRYSPDRRWLGLLFLFWQSSKENESSIAFLPLYRQSKFPGGYSIFLPGFYFLKEREETQGVVGPYLWDHRGKTQYEFLTPVYSYFKRPTWHMKTFLTFYVLKTSQINEEGFFPFWAKTSPVDRSTDTPKHFLADSHRVLPFYFYRKLDQGSDLWLPVVLGRIEKGLDRKKQPAIRGRMFLVNYWEKSSDHFLNRLDPLYSYYRDEDGKGFSVPTAPFPLWQYEREGLESDEDRVVKGAVFPYYWKVTKDSRRDVVVPLYYKRRSFNTETRKEASRTTWLLAYYSRVNHEDSEKKTFFVPFYWHVSSKDESRTIIPPMWMEQGPNFKKEILFPFWWYFERDKESVSVFFPLLLRASKPGTKREIVLMPGFWSSTDEEGSTIFTGIFFRKKSFLKDEKTVVTLPLLWYNKTSQRTAIAVLPLYWRWSSGDRKMVSLFPFYFLHRRENFEWRVTFPLFWNFKTNETDIRVIPPYFSIESVLSGVKTSGVAPFWTYSRDLRKDWVNFQILGGLFGMERIGGSKTVTLLYFLKI